MEVRGQEVLVDGEVVDTTADILTRKRSLKLNGLFDRMRLKRDLFERLHPDASERPQAGLRLAADTAVAVADSLFQTAAFAGFSRLVLCVGGVRAEVGPFIDPPIYAALPKRQILRLNLDIRREELALTWQLGDQRLESKTLAWPQPRQDSPTTLPAALTEPWQRQASPLAVEDLADAEAVVRADEEVSLHEIMAVLAALTTATVPAVAAPSKHRAPLFFVRYSIH